MGVGRPRVGRSEVEGGGGVGKGGGRGVVVIYLKYIAGGCDMYRGWMRYISRYF